MCVCLSTYISHYAGRSWTSLPQSRLMRLNSLAMLQALLEWVAYLVQIGFTLPGGKNSSDQKGRVYLELYRLTTLADLGGCVPGARHPL